MCDTPSKYAYFIINAAKYLRINTNFMYELVDLSEINKELKELLFGIYFNLGTTQ